MKTGLRITGLIAWPLTALIIFLGGFLPLIFGLEMGVYDILLFLLEGLDAYTPDPTYSGGGWILLITVVAVLSAGLVIVLSVVTFFLSSRPFFIPSMIMIIANCFILLFNAIIQMIATVWLKYHPDISGLMTFTNAFYIVPIIEFVILTGMTVLSVFSIIDMKKKPD